jgi:hypothetical protein
MIICTPSERAHLHKVTTESNMGTHGALKVHLITNLAVALVIYERLYLFASDHSPRSVLLRVSLASHILKHPP